MAERRRKKVEDEFDSVTWNVSCQLVRRGGLSELRTLWLDLFLSGRVLGAITAPGPWFSAVLLQRGLRPSTAFSKPRLL